MKRIMLYICCLATSVITACNNSTISDISFFEACEKGKVQAVRLYLKGGGDINILDICGRSPLVIACEKNRYEIVDILLTNKADYLSTKYSLYRYVHDDKILSLLIQRGVPYDQADSMGIYPIHYQAKLKNLKNIRKLIQQGCDINTLTTSGLSPLMILLTADVNADELSSFISLGADVNLMSSSGESPAHIVAFNGDVSLMKILFCNGANLNIKNRDGMTPYDYAVLFDNKKMAAYIMSVLR